MPALQLQTGTLELGGRPMFVWYMGGASHSDSLVQSGHDTAAANGRRNGTCDNDCFASHCANFAQVILLRSLSERLEYGDEYDLKPRCNVILPPWFLVVHWK